MHKISGKRIYDGGMWIKYYLSILFLNARNFVFCRAWLKCWICENFLLSKTAVFQWNYFSPAIPLFVPDRTWGCGDGIEKCSSPIGDGNFSPAFAVLLSSWLIEKCSSPIGDGNSVIRVLYIFAKNIEKCSSPIGDGNSIFHSFSFTNIQYWEM